MQRLFDDGLTQPTSIVSPQSPPPLPPSSATPKSNRQLKKERKAAEWKARLAEKRNAERAAAEASGKLVEFERTQREREEWESKAEKEKSRESNEEIAFLQAKRKRKNKKRKRQAEDQQPQLDQKAKKPKIGESLPLLNGQRVIAARQEKKPLPHLAQLRARAEQLLGARKKLPIWCQRENVIACLRGRDVLIMVGDTGSGKSTQLGQFLLPSPWMPAHCCIAITQPRRVAAINLAKRVAAEMGVRLGEEVGYSVRFDSRYNEKTRIKFLTDGMLLQEMLQDPMLMRYACVVVDEAHERTVDTDIVMGFLKGLVYGERRGGKLKVVIMSATMDVENMATFWEENGGDGLTEEGLLGKEPLPSPPLPPPPELTDSQATIPTPPPIESKNERRKRKKRCKRAGKDAMIAQLLRSRSPSPVSLPPSTASPFAAQTTTASPSEDPSNNGPVFFGTVALFQVPGRQYPVEIFQAPEPIEDYTDAALRTVFEIHHKEPLPGDILVFLTGQDDIESLSHAILAQAKNLPKELPSIITVPLYSNLPPAQQLRAFDPTPPRTRKVILATNIAETSVTVPGVRHVVDCGKSKQKQYRPGIHLESLLPLPISRSSALQRVGRAGREAPGTCYRLYTAQDFLSRPSATQPEILRCDLSHSLLRLLARGCNDVHSFPFLSPPSKDAIAKALESLHALGAIGKESTISPLGKEMASLPLPPQLARVLLAAKSDALDCLPETVDVAAAMQVDNLLPNLGVGMASPDDREKFDEARKMFRRREGDHIMLLELVRAFLRVEPKERKTWCEHHFINHRAMTQVLEHRKQLQQIAKLPSAAERGSGGDGEEGEAEVVSPDLAERVLKSFLKGYFLNTAKMVARGEYKMIMGGTEVRIHPSSCLLAGAGGEDGEGRVRWRECVMFAEAVWTSRAFVRCVGEVRLAWVVEAGGEYTKHL